MKRLVREPFFLLVLTLLLLTTANVHADYNRYTTYGENNNLDKNLFFSSAGAPLTPVNISDLGTLIQPLVSDLDGDGTVEIITTDTTANTLVILDSNGAPEAASTVGRLNNTPTICDIDGDGALEIVGIFGNGTTNRLVSLGYANNELTVENFVSVNNTDARGNVECGRFHGSTGDTANYAMFLDTQKYLWVMKTSGTTWTGIAEDVDGAVAEEAANLLAPAPTIIFSSEFQTGLGTVSFVAGKKFYTLYSDGEEKSVSLNIPGGFVTVLSTVQNWRLAGDIDAGTFQNDIAVLLSGDSLVLAGDGGDDQVYLIESVALPFFGTKALLKQRQKTIPVGQPSAANNQVAFSNMAIGQCIGTVSRECAYIIDYTSVNRPGYTIKVYDFYGDTFTNYPIVETNISLAKSGTAATSKTAQFDRFFVFDENKDGNPDVISVVGKDEAGVNKLYLRAHYGSMPNESITNLALIGQQNWGTTSSDQQGMMTPIPVDLDGDTKPDYIYMTDLKTQLLFTGGGVITAQAPFGVALNGTNGLTSTQFIRTVDNTSDFVYSYALICDVGERTFWNEQFRLGYNETARNTSITPDGSFQVNGVQLVINSTTPLYDIQKIANEDTYTHSTLRLNYRTVQDNLMHLIVFAGDERITLRLDLNKTGNNVSVIQKIFGYNDTTIGSFLTTNTNTSVQLSIRFTPARDTQNNRNYYTVDVTGNGAPAGATTSRAQQNLSLDGTTIKDVEVYTDTVNSTVLLDSIGFFKTSNPEPGFVQFQNGELFLFDRTFCSPPVLTQLGQCLYAPVTSTLSQLVSGGINTQACHDFVSQFATANPCAGVIASNPPTTNFQGDGFSVVASYNNQFYSACTYPVNGTYTQRHFMSSNNTLSWTNYHDLTITVRDDLTTTNGATTGNAGDGSGDIGTDLIPSFLSSIGLTSTASQAGAWMLLVLLVAGLAAYGFASLNAGGSTASIAFLVITLVGVIIGSMIGVMPLWVIVVLVIICAGIVAMAFRNVFVSSGSK